MKLHVQHQSAAWARWSRCVVLHLRTPVGVCSKGCLISVQQIDGSNENGFGEQHPSLATVRGLLDNADGRRLVIHNGDISYARCCRAREGS